MSAKAARLLALFEEDLRVRMSSETVRGYVGHVRAFLAWLDERGITLASVRASDLLAHQADLVAARKGNGKAYSPGHQQNRVSALKGFFRFLVRRGHLLHDPSASLEMPRVEKRLPRTLLSREEAQRLIESVSGKSPRELRDRAILETLYAAGIRVSELIALTPYDVDADERTLKIVLGKGRKGRVVPLTTAAVRAIDAYLISGRPKLMETTKVAALFVSDRGLPLQPSTVNAIIQRHAKEAGITKRVTCHTFRHSLATHLLRGHADIRHIQALLGHRSLQTTEGYTRVEISDLKKVVKRAHPRGH